MKKIKFLLLAFLISLPFWLGANIFQERLEGFFFLQKASANPQLLTAQLTAKESLEKLKPIRNKEAENLKITAKAGISVFVNKNGEEKILFEKNAEIPLALASLTKLMTANVALEYYNMKEWEIKKFLYPLLIESNNNSAIELANIIGNEAFVELMNWEAKKLGMENTYFANPNGLDPESPKQGLNYSTAKDLVKLAKYITFEKPLIWEISTIKEDKNIQNTNKLLGEIENIIGGKTGETELAGQCLLLVLKAPKDKGFIVNIILNSENRFEEMQKLIEWTKEAYHW